MLGCMSHSWKIAVSQQREHGGEWSRGQEDQALEKKGLSQLALLPQTPAPPGLTGRGLTGDWHHLLLSCPVHRR